MQASPRARTGNKEGYGRKASGVKYLKVYGGVYFRSHLYGCCRPPSGHRVKGMSERGPAISQEPHQIQN